MLSRSTHVFSELFLHINWHCANDERLIEPRVEKPLFEYLKNYCTKCKGVKFLGVGGTEDHVHLVIQVEPFICSSEFIGKLKGASSHDLNKLLGADTLHWQRGYGVLSFARRDLEAVLKYVANQKEHHGRGNIKVAMERCDAEWKEKE